MKTDDNIALIWKDTRKPAKRRSETLDQFTPQTVLFDLHLTGPQGAHYTLYPIAPLHTEKDVKEAKQFIRNSFDPTGFTVRWRLLII